MPPCQIWQVAPHLCGFPSDVARRRRLLPLKVYCDESGKSEPPVFVMAGFVAPAENWAAFNDAWQAELGTRKYFHMKEAEWPRDVPKLHALSDIINQHVHAGFVVTVNQEDFKAAFYRKIAKQMNTPYVFMYFKIMEEVYRTCVALRIDEKIDFIFDEQDAVTDFVQANYTAIMVNAPPVAKQLMGHRPISADDKETPGLQAADILAWTKRREMDCLSRGAEIEGDFTHLFPKVVVFHKHIDAQYLIQARDDLKSEILGQGKMFPYELDMIYENLDLVITLGNFTRMAEAPAGSVVRVHGIPSKQTKRFHLVHSCPFSNTPHLHKRSGGECLAAK
jgi:hypothetical protein